MGRTTGRRNGNVKKQIDFKTMAEDLCRALNKHDLGAYVYHIAATGSAYIRFAEPVIGSVRLGDHDGRDMYKYKFNVRSDKQGYRWMKDDKIWRFYCGTAHIDKLINEIIKRRDLTRTWAPQNYTYGKRNNNGTRENKPVVHEGDRRMDRETGSKSIGAGGEPDIRAISPIEDIKAPFELGHTEPGSAGKVKKGSKGRWSRWCTILAFKIRQAFKRIFWSWS